MDAIHVVGAGGIGCAVGYTLLAADATVTFVESDPKKIDAGRRDGVSVDRRPPRAARFVAFNDWKPPPNALVLLCTKCYDNATVLANLPPSALVFPIQNGFDTDLDNLGHAAEGISSFVSECDPGRPHTRITRAGSLHIGPRGGAAPAWLKALADRLRSGGLFRVHLVDDIRPYKYAKLMYNAAISPLAAVAGIDNGQLVGIPRARDLFFRLLRENYAILTGAGLTLGKVGPFHPSTVNAILSRRWLARTMAWAFYPSLRGSYCSMSGDLPKGRTEIANYNERLVEWAGDRPCPLNRRAVEVVRRMERERIMPHLAALKWFD